MSNIALLFLFKRHKYFIHMPIPSIHPYVPTCHSQSGCPANQSDILSLSDVNECAYASSYGELLHLSPQNKPFSM